MRVLMFGIGSRGDAQPMGIFGVELAARGHQVVLGLSSDLVWVGEAFGLSTVDMRISAWEFLDSEDSRRRLASGDYQAYVKWGSCDSSVGRFRRLRGRVGVGIGRRGRAWPGRRGLRVSGTRTRSG